MQSTGGINGEVAQLGERRPCTAKVAGSIPVFSTGNKNLDIPVRSLTTKTGYKQTGIFVRFLVKLVRANGGCLGADRR